MNHIRSRDTRRGAALLLLALSLACKGGPGASRPDGTFALGVGATPGKPGYQNVTRGLQIAVQRLNDEGQAHKVSFSLRAPDAAAASAVQIAQQLRDDPAVIAVVGHPESGSTIEAMPIFADAEHKGANAVVAVSPTASSPRLTGVSPWFFRVAPSDADAARFVAQFVMDSLHYNSAAVIYRNDSYGRDWSARFTEAFQTRRGVVVTRDPYLTQITDWDAYALHLAKLGPQVVLFPGDAVDAMQMIRALRRAKVNIAFVGGDGTEAIKDSSEASGAHYAAFYLPERALQGESKRFLDAYRAKYHEDPDMFAALSYDAAMAIGHTVIEGARSRTEVREALEHILVGPSALDGAGGKIAFNKDHDVDGRTVAIATVGGGPRK